MPFIPPAVLPLPLLPNACKKPPDPCATLAIEPEMLGRLEILSTRRDEIDGEDLMPRPWASCGYGRLTGGDPDGGDTFRS